MQRFLSDIRFQVAFGTWWFAWAQLHMVVLIHYDLPFSKAVADSLVSNTLLAASCLLISLNMQYYLPRRERFWYFFIVSFVVSIIWFFASKFILTQIFSDDAAYISMLNQSSPSLIRFGIALLLTGCMVMISMLWYTLKEQKEMDARRTEAERLAREAELFKLRQQLQPHFLFNSLNSISALTGSQPEKARHMIQQLSDFLRGTLRRDEQQWISLEEELSYLQLYLDIEKVRFGYRLQTSIKCEEDALKLRLPSLLLQPVVENAIKFGLYDTVGAVEISIEAAKKNDSLEITVENPFDKETAQPRHGTGFGLASIKRRLFLLFARHDLLHTSAEENKFITKIIIPQIYEGNNNR